MKLIALVYLLHFTRYGMIYPLVPLYAQQMGCSSAVIGLVVSSFSILSLFLALPIGDLADRFSTKAIMLGGVICNIISSWFLLEADSVAGLMIAQIIGGLGFLLLIVSTQAYVGTWENTKLRERGFAVLTFCAAIGQALGPLLGGIILAAYGFQSAFGIALLLALPGLIVIKLRGERPALASTDKGFREKANQFYAYLSDRQMVATLLFSFIMVFVVSLRTSFIPVLFKEKALAESTIGLLLSISACSMTVIRVVVGRLMGRFSRSILVVWAIAGVFVGVVFMPQSSMMTPLAILMIAFGVGFGISQPLSMVMVSDCAVSGYTGLAMGIRFMTVMAAALLSPLIFGFVADGYGLDVAFYSAAIVLVALGSLVVGVLRSLKNHDLDKLRT